MNFQEKTQISSLWKKKKKPIRKPRSQSRELGSIFAFLTTNGVQTLASWVEIESVGDESQSMLGERECQPRTNLSRAAVICIVTQKSPKLMFAQSHIRSSTEPHHNECRES